MKIQPSRFFRIHYLALALLVVPFSASLFADAAPAKLIAGSKLDTLTVGAATYQNVLIRSVSARSAMITYDGGMKSILLRDLSPELQQRFGYSPEAERAQEASDKIARANAQQQQKARTETLRKNVRARTNASRVDQLMKDLGSEPKVYREVNLRPRFDELGFTAKSQGYRPSCAIFSIVSALEYQSAEDRGSPETFSEEYVYWATLKALGRAPVQAEDSDSPAPTDSFDNTQNNDAGFSLSNVVTGLRAYGVITRDRMPNHIFGKAATPSEDIINDARYSRKLSIQMLPGDEGVDLVKNIVHALNAGLPVPMGMFLPGGSAAAMRAIDSRGVTNRGHAVTIVGYTSPTGRLEDTVFTFRNSWGARWGDNGYGTITYRAMIANAKQAIVLELQ